jgi:hypothetical protein
MGDTIPEVRAAKQRLFLYHFAQVGVISVAATMAGIGRRTVYDWTANDPAFVELLEEAKHAAYDVLLFEARRRAVEGCREPIVSGGKVIGTKLVYSDRLIEFLMKSWRPELHTEKWEGRLQGEMKTDNSITYVVPEGAMVDMNGNDIPKKEGG